MSLVGQNRGDGVGASADAEMLDILSDLECALVMTCEHSPFVTVSSFVESSIQFKRLADFLRQHANAETPKGSPDDTQ